jgi:tetratricopeptide (TPR) repeat protein
VKHREIAAAAMVLLLAALVYAPVVGFDLTNFDDDVYVTDNPPVTAGLSLRGAGWAATTLHAGFWIPLTWLSLMADASLYGLRPGGFHLTNLLLHAASAVLLLLLLSRLTGRRGVGLAVAALFAVHPLHVESVAWVTERKDVLSLAMLLLSLAAWRTWLARPSAGGYLAALGLYLASLAAKPMAVAWPLLLLLLDWWPLGRLGRGERLRRVAEKLPFAAVGLLCGLVTIHAHRLRAAMAPLESLTLASRLATAVDGLGWYPRKMLWPRGLAALYQLPAGGAPAGRVAAVALLIVAALAAGIILRRRRPWLAVGLGWYLAAILPVSGLLQAGIQSTADRFAYLPLLGLYLAIACEAASRRAPSALLRAAALAAVLALAVAARGQAGHWRDSESLFRRVLAISPASVVAHVNLGRALVDKGRPEEGMAHYRRALAIDPSDAEARLNLANALARAGRAAEAAAEYRVLLSHDPGHRKALFSLGVLEGASGEGDAALARFDRLVELEPSFAEAHYQRGVLLALSGRRAEAREALVMAVALAPSFAQAHYNLGVVQASLGDTEGAGESFAEARRLGLRTDP